MLKAISTKWLIKKIFHTLKDSLIFLMIISSPKTKALQCHY